MGPLGFGTNRSPNRKSLLQEIFDNPDSDVTIRSGDQNFSKGYGGHNEGSANVRSKDVMREGRVEGSKCCVDDARVALALYHPRWV